MHFFRGIICTIQKNAVPLHRQTNKGDDNPTSLTPKTLTIMGYRLHSAKAYKVEYGTGLFNRNQKAVNNLLSKCPSVYFNDESDFANEIEVEKADLITLIHQVMGMSDSDFKNEYGFEDGYTKEDVAANLQQLLDEADPDNNYVRLSWF